MSRSHVTSRMFPRSRDRPRVTWSRVSHGHVCSNEQLPHLPRLPTSTTLVPSTHIHHRYDLTHRTPTCAHPCPTPRPSTTLHAGPTFVPNVSNDDPLRRRHTPSCFLCLKRQRPRPPSYHQLCGDNTSFGATSTSTPPAQPSTPTCAHSCPTPSHPTTPYVDATPVPNVSNNDPLRR
jgi:hypothetical protein